MELILKNFVQFKRLILLSLVVVGFLSLSATAQAGPNCMEICAGSYGWDITCSVASYFNPGSSMDNPDYPCVCKSTSGNVCGSKSACTYGSSCAYTGNTTQPTCNVGVCDGSGRTNLNDSVCDRNTDGASCSDSNSCTYSDVCSGEACSGSSYSCTPNECQTGGSCDGSGSCSFTNKASGTACSIGVCDGSGNCGAPAYTYSWKNDSSWGACDSSCGQSRSVWCERNDSQHVADSFCSGTKPDSTQSCSDDTICDATGTCAYANACSLTGNLEQTTCNAGVCNGAPKSTANAVVCNRNTDDTSCSDSNSCTYSDICSGGVCSGSSYSCTPNECQTGGSCNGDGSCSFTSKASGTACSIGVCNGAGACAASGCSYAISNPPPGSTSLSSSGGSGVTTISTGSGCTWLASSSASWFSVSPASGTGNGSVTYSFSAYPSGAGSRTAVFNIGDKSYTVSQNPASSTGCFQDKDCPNLNPCDVIRCNTTTNTCYKAATQCRSCTAAGASLPSRFFCTTPTGSQGIVQTNGVTCSEICNPSFSAAGICDPTACYPSSTSEQYNRSANGPSKCTSTCTDIPGGTSIGITVCQNLSLTGDGQRCDTGYSCTLSPSAPKDTTFSTGYMNWPCSGSGFGGPGINPGPVCGNGVVEGTESCDPPGTFCSSACQILKRITVDAVPTAQDVLKPAVGTNTVTYAIISGYSSATVINYVKFTISGCPSGATCLFPNGGNTIILPYNGLKNATTTLSVTVSTSVAIQSNILTIKAEDAADSNTSATKNLTLNVISGGGGGSCTGMQGYVDRNLWTSIGGASVVSLTSNPNFPNTPNSSSKPNSFEAPSNIGDNYGQRMYGLVKAPVTGAYRFYIASDDNSELWLSTDNKASNKTKIAQVGDWTGSRQWGKYPSQTSGLINLTAGKTYYIEALMKEASGGDNLAVGWSLPGSGSINVIPGSCLSSSSALPPSGNIDTPANGENISGKYWVQGWALDNWNVNETKIQAIKLYVDDIFLADAFLNVGPRIDICNSSLHVGWKDCPNPAWNYLWDTSNLSAGPHILKAVIFDDNDGTLTITKTVITPTPAPKVDLKVNGQDTSVGSPLTVPRKDSSSINLTWTVANADTCTATKSASAPGAWSGAKDKTSGSNTLGSINVSGAHNYTLSCTGPGGNSSDTVYISVPVCNTLPFVSGNVSPSSVSASGAYNAVCDYGVVNNQIAPVVGSGSCSFTNFTGTVANFSCTAGTTVGTYTNNCKLSGPIAPDYYCASTDSINNLSVVPGPTGGPGNKIDAKIATCPVSGVVLTWTAASGANTYNVYRSTHGGSSALLAGNIGNVLTYTDISGTAGTLYDYWVEGKDSVSGLVSTSQTPANTNTSGIAKNTCGSGPGPLTVTVNNGVCGLITVSWSSVAGATYNVYRNTTGNFPVLADRIKQGATGNSYSDVSAPGLYYYWVTSVVAGSESAFRAPTVGSNPFGLNACAPNLSSSDKDITAVNDSAISTSNCNGTDSIPASVQLSLNDKIKFAINLCNSGSAAATGMTVTDRLTNLAMPSTGWNAKYNDGTGDKPILASNISVTGSAPNQIITFKNIPNLPKPGAVPPAIRRITFEAKLSVPTNFSASSARFQNGFTATYKEGSISKYTPLIQFYTGKGIPTIIEIP